MIGTVLGHELHGDFAFRGFVDVIEVDNDAGGLRARLCELLVDIDQVLSEDDHGRPQEEHQNHDNQVEYGAH